MDKLVPMKLKVGTDLGAGPPNDIYETTPDWYPKAFDYFVYCKIGF